MWFYKDFTIDSIELISASSRKFQMLYLILSYRNMSRAGKVSEKELDWEQEVESIPI